MASRTRIESLPHAPLFFCAGQSREGIIAPSSDDETDRLFQASRARSLVVCGGSLRLFEPGGGVWFPTDALPQECGTGVRVFLSFVDGDPRFALILPRTRSERENAAFGSSRRPGFANLFRLAGSLPPSEAVLGAIAVHLAEWVERSLFCGACGAAVRHESLRCKAVCGNPDCGREEFPRIDPVVLVLVTSGEGCVLARQRSFPPNFYAPLAGFVEPGETLDEAARREVSEEVGLSLRSLEYIGSQPWPFPRSVMIGYLGRSDTTALAMDGGEIEDARWFSRTEIREACQNERTAGILLPPSGVLGRRLIDVWLDK